MFKWLWRKKWWIISLLIVGGAIGGVVVFVTRPKAPVVPETAVVKRDTLRRAVEATGSVKPAREFSLDFDTAGRVTAVNVQIGDTVKAGQVLAEVDATSLDLQVERAKAAVAMAEANLRQRLAGELPESVKLADAELRRAEASLAESQLRLDATRRTSELTIRLSELGVQAKQLALDEARRATEPSAISVRSAELSLTQSQYELESARLNAQTSVHSQEAAVAVASAGRDAARAGLDLKRVSVRAVDRAPLDVGVAEAKISLALAEAERAKARLVAPADGVVTDVAITPGESSSPRTSTVFQPQGTSAVKMIAMHAEVEVDVAESDIAEVKLGQVTTMTFDAFGDNRTFTGKVVWVSPIEIVIQDLVYYKVRIALDGPADEIRPGMSASTHILVSEKVGTTLIPQRAVREADGKTTVRVLHDDATEEERTVTVGERADAGLVEITNGVTEGERVITSRAR